MKNKNWLGFAVCLLLLTALSAGAQEQAPAENPVDMTMDEAGLVSLDFRDAAIQNVLQVLALKSGVNIVASPEVTGTVSIQLTDVPWEQALAVILQTYGYAYEQKGNIIVVTTIADLKLRRENDLLLSEQEPLTTEIFTLNFAKAEEAVVAVEKMLSARGKIDFDERTNTLIVTETASQVEKISVVIERLDRITPQVMIEAKIIKTTLDDNETLGIDWSTALYAAGAKRAVTYPFHPTDNNTFASGRFPDLIDSSNKTTDLAEDVFTTILI